MDRSSPATVRFGVWSVLAGLLLVCLSGSGGAQASIAPPSPAALGPLAQAKSKAAGTGSSAPSGQSSKADKKNLPVPVVLPGEGNPAGIIADPFPSPAAEVPSDLFLSPEDEPRGEAFARFALAAFIEETEDLDAAFGLYMRALELDPANARLACRLAGEMLRQKRVEEAVRLLKASHQAAPREPGPAMDLARLYLGQLRQPDNALPFAERAYRAAPDELSAIATYVDVCAAGRLTQRIDDTLRKTLGLAQKEAGFWLRAGDLFRGALMLRGIPPGRSQLERLNNLYRKALDLLPMDLTCIERTADHFALTQQHAEACRFFERAHTLYRQSNKGISLQIGYKWSRALVLNEQVDAAIELLEEVVREHTQSVEAREFLGELYLSQGQLVPALAHFRWALDLDASKLSDHVRLIQLQLRLKRPEDAAETARKAKSLLPDAPGLTMLLAVALGEAKRHNEALEAFANAEQEFSKDKAEALDASFYLTYGAAAERAGRVEQAATLLKKSISLDPENAAEALNYLGFMWVDRNMNLEEAGTLIRKALGLRPNYPAYLDSLGWWYYRKGDLAGAARELRRALERIRREEAAEVYDHLGEVMLKSGRPEEALNAWEAALELDPSLEAIRAKVQAARKPSETN
jgi:tetratricopeptide (TPR) repeat protein